MKQRQTVAAALAGALWLVCFPAQAEPPSNVIINGYRLTLTELAALEYTIGTRILPGNYLVANNGCWLNQSTGQGGCVGGNGMYGSRYGSGEWNAQGDWSHWSDLAEGGVGGTGDGCVYAFGWSNC